MLANQLNACNIPFDAEDHQIMCYGHIVNLSSGWVIDGLTGAAKNLQNWNGPALLDAGSQSYEEAFAYNPVALACTVVWAIQGSGLYRNVFDEAVVNSNMKGWFKEGGNIVKLTAVWHAHPVGLGLLYAQPALGDVSCMLLEW